MRIQNCVLRIYVYIYFFTSQVLTFSGPDCNNRLLCVLFNTFNIDISISNTRVLKIKISCERQSSKLPQSEELGLFGFEPACNLSHSQLLFIEPGPGEGHLLPSQPIQVEQLPGQQWSRRWEVAHWCILSAVIKITLKWVNDSLVFRPPGISSATLNIKEMEYSYVNMSALLAPGGLESNLGKCFLHIDWQQADSGASWINGWANEWMNVGSSRNWLPAHMSFCHAFLFPNRIWILFHSSASFAAWGVGVGVGRKQAVLIGPSPSRWSHAPAMVLTWAVAIKTSLLWSPEKDSPYGWEGDMWKLPLSFPWTSSCLQVSLYLLPSPCGLRGTSLPANTDSYVWPPAIRKDWLGNKGIGSVSHLRLGQAICPSSIKCPITLRIHLV